ncbi:MAG: type II toxin-antitoxin system RelE/ParE family toxin [Terriglobia bacterium]
MQINWTKQAIADLAEIEEYIEQDRPQATEKVATHLWSCAEHLAEFPHLGKRGRRAGTRNLIVPPYVIPYRILSDRLEILSIWDGRRRR